MMPSWWCCSIAPLGHLSFLSAVGLSYSSAAGSGDGIFPRPATLASARVLLNIRLSLLAIFSHVQPPEERGLVPVERRG